MEQRIIAFDDNGNWVDVSGGLTVMTVSEEDYLEAIEELKWRHPSKGIPISTAEQYRQDGVVREMICLDYESQTERTYRRVDLPF